MHPRRELVEKVKQALVQVKQFAWVRNTRQTTYPYIGNSYPGISFYIENESVETLTIHPMPRSQLRQLNIAIRVWIQGNGEIEYAEQQFDLQTERVERAMAGLFEETGNVDYSLLLSTDFDVAEDEPLIHVATLTYQLSYNTIENIR